VSFDAGGLEVKISCGSRRQAARKRRSDRLCRAAAQQRLKRRGACLSLHRIIKRSTGVLPPPAKRQYPNCEGQNTSVSTGTNRPAAADSPTRRQHVVILESDTRFSPERRL